MKNPRVSRRKEIIQIKAEINEKETKGEKPTKLEMKMEISQQTTKKYKGS